MATIADVISRIRGQAKAEVQDAFVTDRYIYSLVIKSAQLLMRRQDHANKLMKFNSVWKALPFVEMIEVDKIEAGCTAMRNCSTKGIINSINKFVCHQSVSSTVW